MKKILLSLVALVVATAAMAQTSFTLGDFKYLVTSEPNKTVEIYEYLATLSTTLTIPSTVENGGTTYKVTSIREGVFPTSNERLNVKHLVLGNYIEEIPKNCFDSYNCLETAYLGKSLKTIGSRAFNYCTKLQNVEFPSTLTTIYDYAFAYCRSITSARIPAGVTSLKPGVFMFSGLETIVFEGKNVKLINSSSLQTNNLISVTLKTETPPNLYYVEGGNYNTFSDAAYNNVYVHVPEGCLEAYRNNTRWNMFKTIIADVPITECKNPSIVFANGKISFSCPTEGVTFHSKITYSTGESADMTAPSFEVTPTTITVSVYASKSNMQDSETITKTFPLDKPLLSADANGDGSVNGADVVSIYNYILNGGAK